MSDTFLRVFEVWSHLSLAATQWVGPIREGNWGESVISPSHKSNTWVSSQWRPSRSRARIQPLHYIILTKLWAVVLFLPSPTYLWKSGSRLRNIKWSSTKPWNYAFQLPNPYPVCQQILLARSQNWYRLIKPSGLLP